MEIYGREYRFRLTVGAACDIADRCPGGELKNFRELIAGGALGAVTDGRIAFVCALSAGDEEARSFEEPGYEPKALTPQILRTLSLNGFTEVLAEATEAFAAGLETSVGVKPAKKNGEGAEQTSR